MCEEGEDDPLLLTAASAVWLTRSLTSVRGLQRVPGVRSRAAPVTQPRACGNARNCALSSLL